MKKLFYIFILIVLISCSENESDSPIVGSWEAISFVTSKPVDENEDGIKNTDLKKELDCIAMDIDFNAKGDINIETTQVKYDISVENGEVIVKPSGCGVENKNGTWDINKLNTKIYLEFIFDESQEPDRVTIDIELTEQQLVLKDMIYEEGDFPITYTVEFKRK
ncbi:MAG: hypothetical protein ABFS16_14970 [Bacteroidota bacterium]